MMALQIGVARTCLTPPWGVELAGLGYYLKRTWQRIRDDLAATALVIDDAERLIALIAVDLMYADRDFVQDVRSLVSTHTNLYPEAICVACSHSHNTPTVAMIRGAGEIDPEYQSWAARQAATAAILAWKQRQPATLRAGHADLAGWTFNRTRENGPVDPRIGVWRADDLRGRPLAAVVNFQAHPTVMMHLGLTDVSRDWPGQVTDLVEEAYPGLTALYVQGACGDINFNHSFEHPTRCHEPGRAVAAKALEAFASSRTVDAPRIGYASRSVTLPTRRWTRPEIQRDREEAEYRLSTGDTTGWRDGLARVIVNYPDKLPERYAGNLDKTVQAIARFGKEWTDQALLDLDTRSETLTTEVQALRVGDAWLSANASELFTSLALDLRRQWGKEDLMIAGYANDSIGYLPDAYDVERRSYAAYQSPKFKNQFPFVAESGAAMANGLLAALEKSTVS
jgi:neutral ceramidase